MFTNALGNGKAAVTDLRPSFARLGTIDELLADLQAKSAGQKMIIVAYNAEAFEKAACARQLDHTGKQAINPDTQKPYALGFNSPKYNILDAQGKPDFSVKGGFVQIQNPVL